MTDEIFLDNDYNLLSEEIIELEEKIDSYRLILDNKCEEIRDLRFIIDTVSYRKQIEIDELKKRVKKLEELLSDEIEKKRKQDEEEEEEEEEKIESDDETTEDIWNSIIIENKKSPN